ncbi:MAG: restriction endonuclease subunit S [Pseudomonadota bacterium]
MNTNQPALRFKQFNEPWENKTLSSICSIERGRFSPRPRNDPRYYGGNIPFVQTSDVTNSNGSISKYSQTLNEEGLKVSKLFPSGTILITIAANIGHCGVLRQEMACPDSLIGMIVNSDNDAEFVCTNLNRLQPRIDYLAPQAAQKNINVEFLKPLTLYLPSLDEQQKIAEFLSTVDKKITLLKEKYALLEQYKKGVMQKLFKQEIRFKDDSGNNFPDWQSFGFGEVFERITRKNKEDNQNVLTISAQMGLVNQEKYFNKSVSAKDLKGYYLLGKGDFAYNKSYSKGYPMGAIKRLNNYDKGVVSTLYICFRVVGEQEPLFWEQFFEAGQLNREINKIAQEGARNHGLLNVSVTEFFNDIEVRVPSNAEQRKIADFLLVLDKKLNAVKEQIELTQSFKKGLLQQMFV